MKAHERDVITDAMWLTLEPLMPKGTHRGKCRLFLEALLFKARTGTFWHDMPERFGHRHAVWTKARHWSSKGWMEDMFSRVVETVGADMTTASLDSTVSKLHKSAHGGVKKNQAKGKTKGGWNTKIHALVDSCGRLLSCLLTPGNRNDVPFAEAVVGRLRPKALLADRAYDSGPFRVWLRNRRVRPVTPAQSTRKKKTRHDKILYRHRNVVERWFGWAKEWKGIAMRSEKNDSMFLGTVLLVAIVHWLKNP